MEETFECGTRNADCGIFRIFIPHSAIRQVHFLRKLKYTIPFLAWLWVSSFAALASSESTRVKVLFLGDNGHHIPAERCRQLLPVLAKRGIDITYTDNSDALNSSTLGRYDCLTIYANLGEISQVQEKALLDFVAEGKGLVAIHCASFCFRNSAKYIELVGAQFERHGKGVFREKIVRSDHPVMQGLEAIESWDESYVHHKHNPDRVVLAERVEGDHVEPWTWVRNHGKGRVFYTAWGHDERTWSHSGFQNLIDRGIRWTSGDWALKAKVDTKPFEYLEVELPHYIPGGNRKDPGRWRTMQLPVDPQESMKHMVLPAGFSIELFAAEPDIVKPICMAWDERGRLWIVETVDYPNDRQPQGQGRDRIKICEDTDGDGRAEKFTVFAEKLSLPTSLTFANGGVIVSQAPDMLFLKDNDGDDKADVREVLFTGWGTYDTHAGPSNLRWGLDNWVWGMVGYAGFQGTVGSEEHSFKMGFFRIKPDGSKLEFLRSTDNNTWGLGFSEEGLVFGSTANGRPSFYMPIPNRYYESVRGWSASRLETIATSAEFHPITDKVRQVDNFDSFTAGAGHALYTARDYPPEYWNRVSFVNGPTGHLTQTFELEPHGSDFVAKPGPNLLASDDEWTAPIMAEVGPDGAVWVIDWYNYIVQHNPIPLGFEHGKGNAYVTPLRDKKHGRIYRIVFEDAEPKEPLDLDGATAKQLVETLSNQNMFWRLTAQRLLVQRGEKDVLPALFELARQTTVDRIGLNPGAIHALWTIHGLGALDGSDLMATSVAHAALENPSAGVRRAAAGVLPPTAESVDAISGSGVLKDEDAQVRLASLLALSEMPASAAAGKAIHEMLKEERNAADRWIPDAATSAAARHDSGFLVAMLPSATNSDTALPTQALPKRNREDGLKPPASSLQPPASVVRVVANHYARRGPTESIIQTLVALEKAPAGLAAIVLDGLAAGWPEGTAPELSDADRVQLSVLMRSLPAEVQAELLTLVDSWGLRDVFSADLAFVTESLRTLLLDQSEPAPKRFDAARKLIALDDGSQTLDFLFEQLTPQTDPKLASGLFDALATSSSEAVGTLIIQHWERLTPSSRRSAMVVLLRRPAWTISLLDGIQRGDISTTELALDQTQYLAAYPDSTIMARAEKLLARGGGLPNPDRQKVLESLLPLADRSGDPVRGRKVYETNCSKCHRHGELGENIAPNLTGFAVHPKEKLLLEIIDPNRSVEGNYQQYLVATTEGVVLSGLLLAETKTAIELLDSEAKKHVVLREDIEELVASRKSLMPEGFEKLPPEELIDLLEFLTQRGTYLPLPLGKAATIVSTRGMFYRKDSVVERLVFSDWSAKTVEGVPFLLIDPRQDRVPNVIMLHSPNGKFPPRMPKSVSIPCNSAAKAIHFLSGVSGWGYNGNNRAHTVSMIVRLHYNGGKTEDHPLFDGEHFADYTRRVDVPESKLAFMLRSQQIRYLTVLPKREETIEKIELIKGKDRTAPIVMAITVERSDRT